MIPNATKREFFNGTFALASDTIRVALYESSTAYSPNPDTVEFLSDFLDAGTTATEWSGSGYSRQTLASVTVTADNTDDEGVFDAGDVTFPTLGSNTGSPDVQGVVLYKQVGGDDTTPGDDRILRIIDDSDTAELPKTPNGEDFTVSWAAEGIINNA